MDQNIWEEHKWGLLLMCGQQNIMAYARDNAGQNKGHTHTHTQTQDRDWNPWSTGDWNRAVEIEDKGCTGHRTTPTFLLFKYKN